jgi:RHS repeat-associated protein
LLKGGAGESYDSSLGVYYNSAREYDQRLGRFWTADEVEGRTKDPRTLHRYLYAGANPVTHTDPSGNDFTIGQIVTATAIVGVLATAAYFSYEADKKSNVVEVDRYAYEETETGVHIVLGAKTLMRRPHYPEYRWVQTVTTNGIRKIARGYAQPDVPFIDPQPPDDDKPYFWTDAELPEHQHQYGFDLVFEDSPSRDPAQYPDVQGTLYWKANLDLVGVDPPGSVNYKPIIHITYGFSVTHNGFVHTDPLHISTAQP